MTRRDVTRRNLATIPFVASTLTVLRKTLIFLLGDTSKAQVDLPLHYPRHLSLLALFSGIAMGLTSAPTNWWPLAWIAQAPLWFLIYRHSVTPISFQQTPSNVGFHTSTQPTYASQNLTRSLAPLPPCPPAHTILSAFLWGLGYYGTTLIWITGLHPLTWMGIPWAASLAIATTCWAIITLWGCIWSLTWAGGLAWICRRCLSQSSLSHALSRVLVGTALWLAESIP